MSSIATFFRTLPDTLQQPAALAMLGSVGAHLLFFATLPAFTDSAEPRPESEVRRVRLLEPPQGRPNSQIARSPIGLPPIPNTPNSRIQLPTAGTGNSPLPNPLYTIPDLTPVPVPNTPAPQSSVDRFNELLRRLRERQQQQAQQNRPITPPAPPSPPASPSPSPAPTIATDTNLKPFDPRDLDKTGGTPSPESAPLPTPTGTPEPTPTTPATEPRIAQAQIDRNNQLLAASRYLPEGTTPQEGVQAAQNLAQQLNDKNIAWEYIRLRKPEEPIRELDYPLGFALQNFRQHPASIAVFIGKDGKPVPDRKPVLLNSTGYQILNDKAIEIVQNEINQPNKFPAINEDKIRVFVYEFQFKAPNTQATS